MKNTKPKWVTVGANMAVELEADLNADPTNEFVIKGQRKGIFETPNLTPKLWV